MPRRQLVEDGVGAGDVDECRCRPLTHPTGDVRPAGADVGELRLSNFLLWAVYAGSSAFTDTLWPDFDADDLRAAVDEYAIRTRRFGGARTSRAPLQFCGSSSR